MASRKVLSPARLAHIVLRTEAGERFQAMKKFYCDFLGAYPEMENEMLSFLRYDDEHHRVAILGVPGIGQRDRSKPGLEVLLSLILSRLNYIKSYCSTLRSHMTLCTICSSHIAKDRLWE
jgi:catechol-2,3-dioxygenase